MFANQNPSRSALSGGVTILFVTRARWLILASGVGSVLGAFVPWATVSSGPQLRSLLNISLSFSVSAIDLDARYGWAIVLCGAVTVTLAVHQALGRSHSPRAALLATATGLATVAAALLVADRAQNSGAPIGWIGSLIDSSSLLSIAPGIGFWLVFASGILGIVGGLMAGSGR